MLWHLALRTRSSAPLEPHSSLPCNSTHTGWRKKVPPKPFLPSERSFAQERGTDIHNSLPDLNVSCCSEHPNNSDTAATFKALRPVPSTGASSCHQHVGGNKNTQTFPTGKCHKHSCIPLIGSRRQAEHSSVQIPAVGTAKTLPSHFVSLPILCFTEILHYGQLLRGI